MRVLFDHVVTLNAASKAWHGCSLGEYNVAAPDEAECNHQGQGGWQASFLSLTKASRPALGLNRGDTRPAWAGVCGITSGTGSAVWQTGWESTGSLANLPDDRGCAGQACGALRS